MTMAVAMAATRQTRRNPAHDQDRGRNNQLTHVNPSVWCRRTPIAPGVTLLEVKPPGKKKTPP
jgi:hypothetical protein